MFQLFELALLLIGKLPFGFLTVFSFWGLLDGCGLLCLLGCRIRLRLQGTPLTILGIVAREILDLTIAPKDQQMVDHLIHEIAVVADDNHAAREILQVFFQYLKRHDVQIVGRLVEHQEVGILHQDGTEIELAPLAAAEFIHIVVLLFGCEEEILQEL